MPDELENAFDFDASELLLNQNGRLSEKQIEFLSRYRRTSRFFGRLAFAVIIGSIALIALLGLYQAGFDIKNNFYPALAVGGVFAFGFLLFLFFYLLGEIRSDLKSGKISAVEGCVEQREKKLPRQLGTAYFVKIGKVKFQLENKAKYKTIRPNACYRIFYIKHPPTHIILSVAEISSR